MTRNELLAVIENKKKGTYSSIKYESEKVVKNKVIKKVTSAVVRLNISYKNTKTFKESGKTEVQPLAWGAWLIDGLLINHTNKKGEYNEYLRMYFTNNKKLKFKTKYFLNGVETTKQELIENGLLKEEENKSGLFNINIDNIISIH